MTPPAVRSRTTTSTTTPRRPRRASRPAGERRQRAATRTARRARLCLCTCGAWPRALGPRRSACAPCAPSRATPSLASRSHSGSSRVGHLPLATRAPGRPPGFPPPVSVGPGSRPSRTQARLLTAAAWAAHTPRAGATSPALAHHDTCRLHSPPAGTGSSSSASAGGGCMPRRTARRSTRAGSRCSRTRQRPRATRRS